MRARILITTDAVGGIWQYTRDLAASLSKAGNSILVCILGPAASPRQLLDLRACGADIQIEQNTAALEWMPDPWRDVDSAGDWLRRKAGIFRPDIVHLNSFSHAALPWSVPVVVVAHSCVGTWWQSVHGCPPGREWREYICRVTSGLQRADAIVAPSAALAADLKNFYRLSNPEIQVIHNCSSVTPQAAIEKQPFCLAAGRFWDEAKNLKLLEQVAGRVSWPVYVAGESGHATNLQCLGKLAHSEFLGYLERASLFLHPALYEPFGLVALEAARCGCALLLSDIASLREVWGDAARFLPAKEPDAWIDAIDKLSSDAPVRSALSTKATHRSLRYSTAGHVNEYLNLYEAMMGAHQKNRAVAV